MNDLRVESLVSETAAELRRQVPRGMSEDTKHRFIGHVIADLSDRLLRMEDMDPRGLIITVTGGVPTADDPDPALTIVATAPIPSPSSR